VLFASLILLLVFIAIRFTILMQKEYVTPAGYFDILISFSGSTFLTQLFNLFKKKENDEHCAYRKHLEDIGILKVYPNRKGTENDDNSYLHDLLQDFRRLRIKDTSEDDPIRMMGVAMDIIFGSDNGILSKITELYNEKSAFFQIMLCRTDNRGLKLRTKLIEKKYPDKGATDFFAVKLYNNIDITQKCIKKTLLNKKKENKYLKYYYYDFSPFATIIIMKDIIYYTPNMVQDDSYLPPFDTSNLEFIESEVSFRIRSDSKLGKKLEDVFNTFWLLHDKEVDEDKI